MADLRAAGRHAWRGVLHPRGRGGRFIDTPDRPIVRPAGWGTQFEAEGPKGEFAVRATKEGAERSLKAMERDETLHRPYEDFASEPLAGNDPWEIETVREHILSGKATTRDEYSRVEGGRRIYTPERQALHRKIVQVLLGSHQSHDHPALFFTGGAFASGKGGVVDGDPATPPHRWKPQDAVDVDPDKVKALLPEFKQLTADHDPEANLRVYEEAWDVSQMLAAETRKRKYNVIVDGVGDNSVAEVMNRVKEWTLGGYQAPKAVYVATPTDVAIHNAKLRMMGAMKKGKLESIRYIPDDVMRDVHRHVSEVFPGILQQWPGELELYDTNTWNSDRDAWDPVRLILRKTADGRVQVVDRDAYARFLAKAHETLREAATVTQALEGQPLWIPWEWPPHAV